MACGESRKEDATASKSETFIRGLISRTKKRKIPQIPQNGARPESIHTEGAELETHRSVTMEGGTDVEDGEPVEEVGTYSTTTDGRNYRTGG